MGKRAEMLESQNKKDGNRKYFYGIIQTQKKKSFSPRGIGDRGEEIYTVTHNGIAGVVSDVSPPDYGNMTKDVLVHNLLFHQQVAQGIMEEHLILPCKFGTMVEDEHDIMEILNYGYSLFAKAFNQMREKVELNMVATWNKDLIYEDILEEEKKAREAQRKIDLASGKEIVEKKREPGELVQSILVAKRKKARREIVTALGNLVEALCDHVIMDDHMVMNASFLLYKKRQHEFEQTVDALEREYGGRLNFRCIGPLPPYSFCMIQIGKIEPEEIDNARDLLRLAKGGILSEAEIKKAYRKLVVGLQPDKGEGTSCSRAKFLRITKAYKMLLDYCRCGNTSSKKPFMIKMARS